MEEQDMRPERHIGRVDVCRHKLLMDDACTGEVGVGVPSVHEHEKVKQ
jgi:hypothetical protein